ncbi:MAG: hypothetical protein SVT52_08735 [Planctomycetota bacterium]|nr:hypothetical protein [Planctomycetota bacterium]
MAVVAGIDEAGFGPVLGPLVVSAAAFELPDELAGQSLWRLLRGGVCCKPARRGTRVAVADSKKLYKGLRGKDGLKHLERGVLAMLAASGAKPGSLDELLSHIAPDAKGSAALYPWYAGLPRPVLLPTAVSDTNVALAGNLLAKAMADAGVRLAAIRTEPVFVGEYNRMVTATKNKSVTLLDVTSRLLMFLWRKFAGQNLLITVDRQGGRVRYVAILRRLFENWRLKVLDEDETHSAYRLCLDDLTAEIHFRVRAEQTDLPVALASMTSKYVRELFMGMLNRFWASHVPQLAPTGGYYVDGRRFWAEVQSAVGRMGLDEQMLYRRR